MSIAGTVCAHSGPTKSVLAALHRRIGTQKFNAWFKQGTSFSFENGQVKVGAANPFTADWIESHFSEDLSAAARDVTNEPATVLVSVDPSMSGQVRKRQLDIQAGLVSRGTSGRTRRRVAPAAPLRHRLDDFVVGSSNRLAYSAAMTVAEGGKTPFNPLFVHGACGVGKTHLLQGLCNAVQEGDTNGSSLKWRYLTAEQFTNEFVEAIKGKTVARFRRNYRPLDLLVIDDVHFLAAKKATQEEFLHTFNTIESAGKQVVMASDAHPRMLGRLAEQLVSRFLSGMVVKIEPPDLATRVKILKQLAKSRSLKIRRDVIDFIATHVRGSVRELEGTLVKLAALAKVLKRPVTAPMARDALADHIAQTDSAVTLGDIESIVSAYFGVTTADLHSSRRTQTVSLARRFAMFLARRHTQMSFPEIGRSMGKNHSSVVLATQRMHQMLAEDASCRWMTPLTAQ